MYENFYGLKEKPFNLTPDPRFIYFTEKHCEALANLVYGIRERKGFLVLSGEVGTGKTTLVNALLDTLDRTGVLSAFIFNPMLSSSEFFEYLIADLNLKVDCRSKSQVLIKLNSLLLERYRTGQITVLIVDEAQNLRSEILEEIRLLTNLETATEKLLQIVLVGQPELSLKLNSPELRQLKQRVNLRCTLDPLSLFETTEYIRTRLEIAGCADQRIFTESTIVEIFRWSGGIPRLINTLCDNAMLSGYACDRNILTPEIIREIAEDLELAEGHRYPLRVGSGGQNRPSILSERSTGKEDPVKEGADDGTAFDLFAKFVGHLRDQPK
jgi:general secretion pathway protein A